MKPKALVLMSALLLISAAYGLAQEQTGSVFGTVTNTEGAVISDAKVVARSPSLIRPMETVTNERGYYVFPALPVGTYSITFSADQYKTLTRKALPLTIGMQLRISVMLETGVVGEDIITITGETPLVDVKSSDTGINITKELFASLPKGRNFTSIVTIAPGAVDQNLTGGIEIDGASKAENIWVIDGVDVSSMYGGEARSNANFEFVEEVQVRSGGYDAEFGGSMGGVVNVITRSGGNEFHGEGTFYLDNSKLDGNRRKTLRLNPLDSDVAEYVQYDKDDITRYEFGGGIGGYVLKDRIWFFGSYMPVYRDITRNVKWRDSNENIIATEPFEQQQRTHQAAIKVSAQVTSKLRASGSYNTDWYQWKHDLPGLNGHSSRTFDWDAPGFTYPGYNIAASADYLLSDNVYASFKGGYHNTDTKAMADPPGVRHYHLGRGIFVYEDDPAFASVPEDYRVPRGWTTFPYDQGAKTEKDMQEKQNWSGDLTYFTEAAGSHMFKGGVQYYRIAQDIQNAWPFDYIRLYWDDDTPYNNWNPDIDRGVYGYYEIRHGHPKGYGTVADISSSRYAIFFQDSWGITDRLTLNIGVRTEKEDIPSFSDLPEYQDNPIEFSFQDKLAPRIGVAYDFFGDGKMKVYGNYAVYYDVMKLEMAEGSYGGMKWQSHYKTLDTLEWWTIGAKWSPGAFPKDLPQYPGQDIGHRDWRIPSFDTTDPDLKPTGIWELILGADYQLSDNMAANIRFVHKRLIRTIEDVGVMTPDGEHYFTTNPGFGLSISEAAPGSAPVPKAKRHYWAVEMRLLKRLSNNWQAGGNLTLSRLSGNYSGLASSDEQTRNSPNVERYFDWWVLNYDASWNLIDGPLPTDRRYVLKLFGSYVFDTGFLNGLTVGLYEAIMDGTPHQTDFTIMSMDGWYPLNRGDMGRSSMMTQTDLYAEYNFRLGEYRAQFNVNVINLFDQKTAHRIYHWYNRNNPGYSDEEVAAMYASKTPIPWKSLAGTGDLDPRYGMKHAFQSPRTIRLGLKFFF